MKIGMAVSAYQIISMNLIIIRKAKDALRFQLLNAKSDFIKL